MPTYNRMKEPVSVKQHLRNLVTAFKTLLSSHDDPFNDRYYLDRPPRPLDRMVDKWDQKENRAFDGEQQVRQEAVARGEPHLPGVLHGDPRDGDNYRVGWIESRRAANEDPANRSRADNQPNFQNRAEQIRAAMPDDRRAAAVLRAKSIQGIDRDQGGLDRW